MKSFFIFIIWTLFIPTSAFCAKNVILFIGDGMGPNIVSATRIQYVGASGHLAMDRMPHTAFVKTYCSDDVVTDSAAASTAMATGQKTNKHVVSQDHTAVSGKKDGKKLKSIAEIAKSMGKAVGIVTTSRLTHATPAAFYAHSNFRKNEKAIAAQLLASPFELFSVAEKNILMTTPSPNLNFESFGREQNSRESWNRKQPHPENFSVCSTPTTFPIPPIGRTNQKNPS